MYKYTCMYLSAYMCIITCVHVVKRTWTKTTGGEASSRYMYMYMYMYMYIQCIYRYDPPSSFTCIPLPAPPLLQRVLFIKSERS